MRNCLWITSAIDSCTFTYTALQVFANSKEFSTHVTQCPTPLFSYAKAILYAIHFKLMSVVCHMLFLAVQSLSLTKSAFTECQCVPFPWRLTLSDSEFSFPTVKLSANRKSEGYIFVRRKYIYNIFATQFREFPIKQSGQ